MNNCFQVGSEGELPRTRLRVRWGPVCPGPASGGGARPWHSVPGLGAGSCSTGGRTMAGSVAWSHVAARHGLCPHGVAFSHVAPYTVLHTADSDVAESVLRGTADSDSTLRLLLDSASYDAAGPAGCCSQTALQLEPRLRLGSVACHSSIWKVGSCYITPPPVI